MQEPMDDQSDAIPTELKELMSVSPVIKGWWIWFLLAVAVKAYTQGQEFVHQTSATKVTEQVENYVKKNWKLKKQITFVY